MSRWRTAIVHSDATSIFIRGREVTSLMRAQTFTDHIVLLHQGRLPTPGERRLLDAILIGLADHGAGAPSCAAARMVASSNRESAVAAIGAGVLAIGNDHGGAGATCMALIAEGVALAAATGISVEAAARQLVERAVHDRRRLPGLGHRVHTTDPRVATLFALAEAEGIAGDGVAFVRALETAAAAAIKPLPLNIDGALAALLHDMGFPPPFGRFLFVIGRVAGITAEVAEEHAREKPMRVTFDVDYDGEPPRRE
jgi:citrate synthase